MRIGLMGGTFDPIHFGHLFIAEEARVRCGLTTVVFFPNRQPAHREGKSAHADPETRCALAQLGIQGNPHFRISRVELDRPGPSYAIDTVRQLQAELGADAELFFIVGADSVGEVLTWHRGAELFERCRFAAVTRPGFSLEAARGELSSQQLERVVFLETVGLDIASREIRQRVRENLPIRYLTPDTVEQAIRERGLYK
ncbi:MAG TPA: nicotinate-nucleotide adenylyltransferase [Abditibacteriaceae bacterium]|nr:nicotinate-nucleotide adenylyltransferase [Abditibacteriaceae bacterium]